MDIHTINKKLSHGEINVASMFPHLARLKASPYVFQVDFGLDQLPLEGGILLIRGARQYGKSTWLEGEILKTIEQFGSGTAYYLSGEHLAGVEDLEKAMDELIAAFPKNAQVRRIFIDEITAIPRWEMILKRMADRGKLKDVLVVTTGSKATDLRRGSEKLPGRKGRLQRTTYLFTPISYKEFHRVCGSALGDQTVIAYLLSGGSPIACAELASQGVIPEFVIELVRDWIEGELVASGRSRSALFNIMSVLYRLGENSVGQAKLAREAGLANNTVALGYIEILNDLGCVVPAYPWDFHRKLMILRKPCKYHFMNVLAAVAYHPERIRSPRDFLALPEKTQGMWYEWLVAQEIQRRNAINNAELLAPLAFWQNKDHEIDFVLTEDQLLEVKRGMSSPIEWGWFNRLFPNKQLVIVNSKRFETRQLIGVSLESFLLET